MAHLPETEPGADRGPTLQRAIGPRLLLLFIVGDVLGTGIYALTGHVAGKIGGALWLPFAVAFAVAILTAFSYLELVGKYPRAAGAALYAQKAFGSQFLTFMVAFAVMASGITSSSSAARAFGGENLQEFFRAPTLIAALVFMLLVAAINFRGIGESVKVNVVITLVELGGLVIVIAVGLYAVAGGRGDPGRLIQIDTADQSALLAITSAASLAFFAMVGFEDSVNVVEETVDPARVFPRALLWGLALAAGLYVTVASLSSMLLTPAELVEAGDGALTAVVALAAPGFPIRIFALIALFAVANSALINMIMASRLVYGMAREGIVPGVFGLVHRRRRTPWVAILFTTGLALGMIGVGDVAELGGTTSLLLLVVFTIVNVAVLVLRRDHAPHEHFRAPPCTPLLGAVTCAYLASPLSGRPAKEYVLAALLLVIGLLLWATNHAALRWRSRREGPPAPRVGR